MVGDLVISEENHTDQVSSIIHIPGFTFVDRTEWTPQESSPTNDFGIREFPNLVDDRGNDHDGGGDAKPHQNNSDVQIHSFHFRFSPFVVFSFHH